MAPSRLPATWKPIGLITALPAAILGATAACGQELSPRAYWPAPIGTNVAVASYQYTTGDIVTDPSLPITGVDSQINVTQLSFQHHFGVFGRTANVLLSLPYSWETTEGSVEGEFRTRETAGLGDARIRLAVNLVGAPAMDGSQFQALRATRGRSSERASCFRRRRETTIRTS